MEPATVEWSSSEIEALLATDRAARRPASVRLRMPCREPTIVWPEPVVSGPRSMPVERASADLVGLAWLAVIGFAMGLSGIAVLCAIAQRPWL